MRTTHFILLAIIYALTPLAHDMYIPAMGIIATDMQSSLPSIQSSLAAYTFAFGLTHIFFGPMIDRFGRKPILVWGLFAFVLSTMLCVFAKNSAQFIIIRMIQGAAGAASAVVVPAIIRDFYRDAEYAHALSTVTLISLAAPLVAPIAGGYITKLLGWNWIFYILAILSIATLIAANRIEETIHDHHRQTISFGAVGKRVAYFWKMDDIRHLLLCSSFSFAGLFSFLVEANKIYVQYYQVPIDIMGYFTAANVVGLIIMTRVNQHYVRRLGTSTMLKIGITIQTLSGVALIVAFFAWDNLLTTCLLLISYMSCVAIIGSNTQTIALNDHPQLAGTLSSILSTARYVLGGLAGFMVSFASGSDPLGTFIFMLACAIAMTWCGFKGIMHSEKRHAHQANQNTALT